MSIRPISILFLFILFSVYGSSNTLPSDTTKVQLKPNTKKIEDLTKGCKEAENILNIIYQAIEIGAPTYNNGNHAGCYLIYEGAAYKILHKYANKCKLVKTLLEEVLKLSYLTPNVTEKAWVMRMAFDKILGEPTTTR